MAAERTLPLKQKVAEELLVQDMAESVADHGFKVSTHTVKEDHERGETTLTVKFVRANPDQGVLDLKGKKAGADNGDGGS